MRNSINGAWLLGIMLTFMAVFIAFIAITFNYRSAFEVKTNIVDIIEKNNGVNATTLSKINSMLKTTNYKSKSKCPEGFIGITAEDDGSSSIDEQDKNNYCLRREVRVGSSNSENKYYYDVYVFFNFSLPVIGDLFTFKINGTTGAVYYPNDTYASTSLFD